MRWAAAVLLAGLGSAHSRPRLLLRAEDAAPCELAESARRGTGALEEEGGAHSSKAGGGCGADASSRRAAETPQGAWERIEAGLGVLEALPLIDGEGAGPSAEALGELDGEGADAKALVVHPAFGPLESPLSRPKRAPPGSVSRALMVKLERLEEATEAAVEGDDGGARARLVGGPAPAQGRQDEVAPIDVQEGGVQFERRGMDDKYRFKKSTCYKNEGVKCDLLKAFLQREDPKKKFSELAKGRICNCIDFAGKSCVGGDGQIASRCQNPDGTLDTSKLMPHDPKETKQCEPCDGAKGYCTEHAERNAKGKLVVCVEDGEKCKAGLYFGKDKCEEFEGYKQTLEAQRTALAIGGESLGGYAIDGNVADVIDDDIDDVAVVRVKGFKRAEARKKAITDQNSYLLFKQYQKGNDNSNEAKPITAAQWENVRVKKDKRYEEWMTLEPTGAPVDIQQYVDRIGNLVYDATQVLKKCRKALAKSAWKRGLAELLIGLASIGVKVAQFFLTGTAGVLYRDRTNGNIMFKWSRPTAEEKADDKIAEQTGMSEERQKELAQELLQEEAEEAAIETFCDKTGAALDDEDAKEEASQEDTKNKNACRPVQVARGTHQGRGAPGLAVGPGTRARRAPPFPTHPTRPSLASLVADRPAQAQSIPWPLHVRPQHAFRGLSEPLVRAYSVSGAATRRTPLHARRRYRRG